MPQQKPPSDSAKIIIIVCVVLFVVLLLAVPFITGLIGGLMSGVGPGGGSTLVPVTGQLTIPSGSGRGTLSIEMMNTANSPITSVSVVVPSSLCTGCSLTMKYNGLPISSSNPLPIGSTASGIVSTTSGSTGTTYSITATILFQGGGQQVQTVDITALL
jgi:hypothetical protein